MKSQLFLLSILAFFMVALSDCTVEFITEINADGSGDFEERWAVNFSTIQPFEEIEDPNKECVDLCDELELGETMTPDLEEKDGDTWCACNAAWSFDDLEELDQIYQERVIDEYGLPLVVDRLTIEDSQLTYDLHFDSPEDLGIEEEEEIELLWKLVLPGRPTDHNADEVEGKTLTWNLSRGNALQEGLHATSGPSESSTTLTIILVAVVVVLIVAVLAAIAWRRSRQAKDRSSSTVN